ncbi:glycosyltransferase [Lampropedia hyalina]|jgi:hypothetical protein|uniref:glycosyltransferase n=1 Tax=Lampropedia hyalina TaxID=198706 RepID=UPI001F2C2311|nr:glycosyltransferase [Lampropedia hyalina]
MKFLMISGYAESLLRFRGDLIMAVAKKGHEICLSAPKIKEDNLIVNFMIENNIKGFDFPMERTGMNPIRDIVSFYHLYRLIKKEQPDIVFAYTVKPVIYGMIAARLAGVPARFSLISGLGHAFSEGASDFLNSLVRILYKISISLSSKIFLQNPDDEILLKKYRIISEKKSFDCC